MREQLLGWMAAVFFVAGSVVWMAVYSAAKAHSDRLGMYLGGTLIAAMLVTLAISSLIAAGISRRITRLEEQFKELEESKDE